MNEAISDIEKRAQLSVPLLRSIEDALTVYNKIFQSILMLFSNLESQSKSC